MTRLLQLKMLLLDVFISLLVVYCCVSILHAILHCATGLASNCPMGHEKLLYCLLLTRQLH